MEKLKNRVELLKFFNDSGFKIGAEIGVWKAAYSSQMLTLIELDALYCIDPWNGIGMSKEFDGDEVYNIAKATLAPFDDRVKIIRKTSEEAANEFHDGSLDFVYLDGLHDYDSVILDIQLWKQKIKKNGGILCGHDYGNRGKKRVKRAVTKLFSKEMINVTGEKCSSWWIKV